MQFRHVRAVNRRGFGLPNNETGSADDHRAKEADYLRDDSQTIAPFIVTYFRPLHQACGRGVSSLCGPYQILTYQRGWRHLA